MRYTDDGGRYDDGNSIARFRPSLTVDEIEQVQILLIEAPVNVGNYPQITADQNDFSLIDGTVHILTSDASRTITGFSNVKPGVINMIVNGGSQNIVIANDNAGSLLTNRTLCHTGANITLNPNESAFLFYDSVNSRCRTGGFV